MSKPITVVSFGPGICVPGGITRVIDLIGTHLSGNFQLKHVPTFTRYTGDAEVNPSDRGSRSGQLLVYLAAIGQAIRFKFHRRTIFHIHFAGRGSVLRKGVLCALLRLMQCQYVIHSHAADINLFPQWTPGFLRHFILWGLTGARKVIVLSTFWREFYAPLFNLPESRFLVLPNPADLPEIIPDRSGRPILNLLFLGRIGERKGAFDLIRAFARIDQDVRSRSRLILAGDGDVTAAQALVDELGIANQVHMTGWISADEVQGLLENSDILLLPSRAEGMAMALIEAMSWGLAVVATNVGGASEFLEDGYNSILVQPGDIDAISTAIATLDASSELRAALGHAARETIARFAIPGYVATLRALYEEVATRGTQPSQQHRLSKDPLPANPVSPSSLDSVEN
jgi:glycosyltransferase involved in cell wall biosynthesis